MPLKVISFLLNRPLPNHNLRQDFRARQQSVLENQTQGGSVGGMKSIDIKSLIIGTLLTSTIFLGVAATSPTDKWDNNQQWEVRPDKDPVITQRRAIGYESFAYSSVSSATLYRRRIK